MKKLESIIEGCCQFDEKCQQALYNRYRGFACKVVFRYVYRYEKAMDAAFNNSSKYLYVLNSGDESISVFEVMRDGSLMNAQMVTGLPDGATGLVSK